MSKLEKLINELCPNGVEYKKLKNVCKFVQGYAFKNNTFRKDGIGIVRTTNIQNRIISTENMVYIKKEDYTENLDKYLIPKNRILIGMSGTIKVGMNLSNDLYYLNQRVGMFIPNEDKLNNKFLFYILDNNIDDFYNMVSGSSVKNLSSKSIEEYCIPVPPLEVQCEIVHILDDFTLLSAELKARQKQYEYYRDELFRFKNYNEVEYVKLGNVAEIIRGGNFQKKD